MSTNKSIAKSAGIISLAILSSRILGFIRDMIIARLFGVAVYAQAFVVAFKIPNLLRDSVGEGAANAAFVPVFSEYSAAQARKEFWELANIVLNALAIVLAAVSLLGIVLSPLLVRIMAPGFAASPEKLAVTVRLNQIIFPYIFLISLAAYATSLLNVLRHFTVPAFAPCLLNLSIIICALIWGEGVTGLASGVLIGGVLQLAVQAVLLYKKGFRYKFTLRFSHPAVKNIGRLMVPRVFSSSVYQLNNLIDSIFGSLAWIVGEGGVAVLYFSYRLIQFPLGIFSNALSQAILPTMSTQAHLRDRENLTVTLIWGLRTTFFVMLPASIGFMVLSFPIVSTIFGGGRFDISSAQLTANALLNYSIGLFAYGGTKIVQSCFFAMKDTRTPAKVAAFALMINFIFNAILMFMLQIGGIALATSISGIYTFIILYKSIKKKLGNFDDREIAISFLRILLASLCMGVVCIVASFFSEGYCKGPLMQVTRLVALVVLGCLSYILSCVVFKVSELRQLWEWVSRSSGTPNNPIGSRSLS
jgi:putative peptidoglycan lipid II flippase